VFIFGPSVWLRGLIKPPPGYGIAYIDWAQQEFGIAAALSGDPLMMDAYRSGDPYLAFAKHLIIIIEAVGTRLPSESVSAMWLPKRWPPGKVVASRRL
jgi:hypothetical protein